MDKASRNNFTTHDLVCKAVENYSEVNYEQFGHSFPLTERRTRSLHINVHDNG
jgi:hypothetical protein